MQISFSGLFDILGNKMSRWLEAFVGMLPNLILAAALFLIFWFAAKTAKELFSKVVDNFSENKAVNRLMSTVIYLFITGTGFFVALGILKLDKAVTSLLAGAGVIGLALGFAFQEIASNFIAGIMIAFIKPYKTGDIVKVGDYQGTVDVINLRTTNIETYDGLEVIIPNKVMFTETVVNYTSTPKRRIELDVGVTYDANLREVERITKEALEQHPDRLSRLPLDIYFYEFGDSSINFKAYIWVRHAANREFKRSVSQAIILIKEAFDQNGITIPFPIRTLDFPKEIQLARIDS